MKRLILTAAALLLTALPADAGERRKPVRRVAAFVVLRPFAGLREPGAVVRERSATRVFGPVASPCGPAGCPIPARGK